MTIQEIIAQAEQVRTNNTPDSNTPALVGGVIKELALAHKAIAEQMQGGKLIKRIELICDDTKITRKGSDVALNYVQVKQLVDNPEFFVTLNYLGLFWMLPAYDDGGAIMFSSADILGGHVVVTRVIMNTASELNNYSIIAEDVEHKVDDLSSETALDGHPNYPTVAAVNNALKKLYYKGIKGYYNLDDLYGPNAIGLYDLRVRDAGGSPYGMLIVTCNWANWYTQFYIGSLDPTDKWNGNVNFMRIYARGFDGETWNNWKLIASEKVGDVISRFHAGQFDASQELPAGVYAYVTLGRPAGSMVGEQFILFVDENGRQTCFSMRNPNKIYRRGNYSFDWELVSEMGYITRDVGGIGSPDEMMLSGIYAFETFNAGQITGTFDVFVERSVNADANGYFTVHQRFISRAATGKIYERVCFRKQDPADSPINGPFFVAGNPLLSVSEPKNDIVLDDLKP